MGFEKSLDNYVKNIEALLGECVYVSQNSYNTLEKAMAYSLFSKGKRIRPLLVVGCSKMFNGNLKAALYLGCAVECVHAASLIHDDMPCMDDSCLRRGVKTCHVKFGEATALLAGTALYYKAINFLVLAFYEMQNAEILSETCKDICAFAGVDGMMGGQQLDIESKKTAVDEDSLRELDELKTASLIKLSCKFGGYAGFADQQELALLEELGSYLGWAFQICDDILDLEGDEKVLGKPIKKDKEQQKTNNAVFYGLDNSKMMKDELQDKAYQTIDKILNYGDNSKNDASFLKSLIAIMLNRVK